MESSLAATVGEDSVTVIDSPRLATAEIQTCTYNLFRNRQRPQLVCAVPEDRPVPGFVLAEGWLFDRALHPFDAPPRGFHARAASMGVRLSGFYLFHILA
jgi:hypothetical protein